MKEFYAQALFSVLILTGLSVGIYVYESTDELIQISLYGKDAPALEEGIELAAQGSINQIDENILKLLERESDIIIQAKVYAQVYGNDGFFLEVAESLKNHLGFVQVLYNLTEQDFPVPVANMPQVPLEATISDGVRINNQEAEELLRLDLEVLNSDYQSLLGQGSAKEQKVILSFQNLVTNRIQ